MSSGGGAQTRLTYEDALAYITGLGRFGMKLGLERMGAILAELGHPERGRRGALIAGTNGKGSTSAFLESILRAGGLRTGMTPSPHLSSYTERVQLDGEPIAETTFAQAVAELRPRLEPVIARLGEPTEFEALIALAISWLAPRADRLVIEVGMGGRLDSTNVLDLGVAIVTNVTLDHRKHLGSTVGRIAAEKAGIIKAGNVVVTGATGTALRVVERASAACGAADLWRLGREIRLRSRWRGWAGSEMDVSGPGFAYSGLRTSLVGAFQPGNAALAVAAAHALGDATPSAVRAGVAAARWPGRLERVGERLILDGAHNQDGMRKLVRSLRWLLHDQPVTVVFGAMADKDLGLVFDELRRLEPDHVVFTAAPSAGARAVRPRALASGWGGPAELLPSPVEALARARELAGAGGWVLVTGSLYLVGELRDQNSLPPGGGGAGCGGAR
ncbi:MAG TPA: cyanophycin synthetase [Candidatus Dormibacteraeota bacterium]|nr:cyanophycin synthetase [Candidatus Dormibacteraeota bacterium]